jgi:hypothetical protein
MIALRAMPFLLALGGVALVSYGCESTQSKSAGIAAELGPVQEEKGLKIAKRSKDVEVVSATVLNDAAGSAVVVRVRSRSARDLAEVPIAIDVRDAAGKSVYRNDVPGLEPALTSIPYVEAGGEAYWVNDQILATGKPDSVEVTIGAGGRAFEGELPKVSATDPKLEGDPYSGVVAAGELVNESGERQERVLIYAVATEQGRVVAAGRGAIENLKPEPKPLPYNVYFIGDPRRAAIDLELFPILPGAKE